MSDQFDNTEQPVDVPASETAPPPPSTDQVESKVVEGRHTVLSQLAKDESIEGYAAERQDQEDYFDRGEKLDERRDAAWYRRAHKALTDAANEAAGIKVNEQGEQQPQEAPPGYVPGDEAVATAERARKEGAAAMRVEQYFGANNEAKQAIVQWHQALDPESKVAEWVIENETPFAPQIMQALADNPDALQEVAAMSPQQRDRVLGMLEGKIAAEQTFSRQMQGQQQQWQQERRTTRAPPIITPPRGAANPPSDLHRLAASENVSDYVRLRQQQDKRRD